MRTEPTDLTKRIVAFRNFANAPKNTWECLFVFHLLNYFADVDGFLYESCATGGYLSVVRFNSLHSYTNMADARTCQV